MSDDNIILLVMQIATMLITLIAPLITAFTYFIKHISKSKCCGGSIELRKDSEKNLKPDP